MREGEKKGKGEFHGEDGFETEMCDSPCMFDFFMNEVAREV